MKLKICGLTTIGDIDCVNKAGVDFAGFVFTSHRQQIDIERARTLKSRLDSSIKAVGVFVDESYDFIKAIVDEKIIDLVQFHGECEYPLPCPTIKAFRMRSADDIKPTECDFVLFDAFKKGERGSTGGEFDWQLLESYNGTKPFFLAGGINAKNIEKAISKNPFCIDMSSGVEENGVKSLTKILEVKQCINKYYQRSQQIRR